MEVFAYDPRVNRETLASFNERVNEFCDDEAVIGVEASVIGSVLMLCMTTADDTEAMEGMPTVRIVLKPIDSKDADIEEQLGAHLRNIYATDMEEALNTPVGMKAIPRLDKPGEGWVMFTCINGSVEKNPEVPDEAGIPTVDGVLEPE